MPDCHVIRLRGPWHFKPLARLVPIGPQSAREETHDLPPSGKTQVPTDEGGPAGADFFGLVHYTRHFNCPTNLDAGERVWLICERVAGEAQFWLNDAPVMKMTADGQPGSCDVTPHLAPRNELVVEVIAEPGRGACAIPGEVRLEIRRG